MGHHGTQFRAKADLPVGFPYRFNSSFIYCYERDFMADLHKSIRYDLIDMFNDTSRYLDDIFTVNNQEFDRYIPDIYIQQNFS